MSQDVANIVKEAEGFLDELFSTGNPLQHLLNHGTFPEGWAERYLAFIERVFIAFGEAPTLPPEVLAVVYSTSVYCTKRYNDWCSIQKTTNASTFSTVNQLRWAADRLILSPFYPTPDASEAT